MKKQFFFLISSYLIIYSFSADTDACASNTDSTKCKEDTTNNCEWTETKASCAAATCTGLTPQATCEAFASCEWDTNTCKSKKACSELGAATSPTCALSTYCTWNDPTCSAVDCTKLEATDAACVATKGCAFKAAGGTCAKKSTTTSGGNDSSSTFGLKTSLTLIIIGFLF